MKNILTTVIALLIIGNLWAQAPNKMSYQALVRDGSNELVTDQPVGMQISILKGSIWGSAVYVETQTPTTNFNGLVSLEIGSGTLVWGDFTTIDWSAGPYFIKTETDPTGGTSYTITGTSQLMSVPYALHANTADSIVGGTSFTEVDGSVTNEIQQLSLNGSVLSITKGDSVDLAAINEVSNNHYIGEEFGGGVIFYLNEDSAGNQHGLIVSLKNLGTTPGWYTSEDGTEPQYLSGPLWGLEDVDVPNCESNWDGQANTEALVLAGVGATEAAGLCVNSTDGGFTDWYLPSIYELKALHSQLYAISSTLQIAGESFRDFYLYSSTEGIGNTVKYFIIQEGKVTGGGKNGSGFSVVRAIRKFKF